LATQLTEFGGFKGQASLAKHGIAVIFDLEDFSKFFNQPDVQDYIPVYLNKVIAAVEICLFGGEAPWRDKDKTIEPLTILPIHRKFLGDGMLYVWSLSGIAEDTVSKLATLLCNRLWNIKTAFRKINKSCAEVVPVLDLPPRIRFGVGRGTIYELSVENDSSKEYIGFCVNLASRLQRYCSSLGFIASARLSIKESDLANFNYTKIVATKIKGFPKEIVIVDKKEYEKLDATVRKDLFDEL
jgi:class 3 adenylate cyclase